MSFEEDHYYSAYSPSSSLTTLEGEGGTSSPSDEEQGKTLRERIEGKTILLFNYLDHPGKSQRDKTGMALLSNKTLNLSILEVDLASTSDDREQEASFEKLLEKLDEKDVVVRTASGSIHIYVNTADFAPKSNRLEPCFSYERFDVNLFSCVNENEESLVVLPGSKVKKNHRGSPISLYEFVQGSFDTVITRTVKDIIAALDLKIKIVAPPVLINVQSFNYKDPFVMNDIRRKAEAGEYTDDASIIMDVSRVIRYVENRDQYYIQKVFNPRKNGGGFGENPRKSRKIPEKRWSPRFFGLHLHERGNP